MLARIEGGLTYEGTQLALEQFIESWLNGKALPSRPKTVLQYKQIVTQHIVPIIGGMRLQEIHPPQIQQLYALRGNEGCGARTAQLIHVILHNVFKQAVREGILGRNPLNAVERPRVEQAEMQVLTEEQAHQFLIAVEQSRFKALYYLALTTGVREGELLGLKWPDVNWMKGSIFVQRQLQYIRGQGHIFTPPKTKAGRREINRSGDLKTTRSPSD